MTPTLPLFNLSFLPPPPSILELLFLYPVHLECFIAMTSACSKQGNAKCKQKGRTARKGKNKHDAEKCATRERVSSFTTTTNTYADNLYRDAVEDSDLDAFLEETARYDSENKAWLIPEPSTTAEDLLGPMFDILSSIVRQFVKPTQSSVKREVISTHDIPACEEKNEDGYRAYPSLFVQAAGPSFEVPKPLDSSLTAAPPLAGLGFTNMATYFSVKRDSELGSAREIANEMASYAGCVSDGV